MEEKMKKSFSGLVTTLVLVASVTIATPSFAANKAGGSCTKANATTKIGGDKYVCTKNPIAKNAKLTWVWDQCITANKDYVIAQNALNDSLAKAKAELAKIDADITTYSAKAVIDDAIAKTLTDSATAFISKANLNGVTTANKAWKADYIRMLTLKTGEPKPVITKQEQAELAKLWGTTEDKVPWIITWLAGDNYLEKADLYKQTSIQVEKLKAQRAKTVNFQTTMKNSATTSLQSTKSTRDQACKPGL